MPGSIPPAAHTPAAYRAPRWLGPQQRAQLAAVIRRYLHSPPPPAPPTASVLEAVLTELEVASARDHMWPHRTLIARIAAGHPNETVPIRISDSELTAVLSIPDLPGELRDALTCTT